MSGTGAAQPTPRCGALAEFFALVFVALPLTHAASDDPLPPLRRVYIPSDQLQALGERYPDLQSLTRDEFENLVQRAQQGGQPSLPQVEAARYHAVLDGHRLIGTAELEIRGKRDDQSMVRWPASPWAISNAQWSVGDASLGYTRRGELGLLVPPGETHTLRFHWSISTRSTEAGARFEFRVPRSFSGELALDLPRGLTPVAPGAVVSGPTNAPRPELQRWLLRWSPADTVSCLLVNDGGSRAFAPLVVYGRDMEIGVAEDATELRIRLDLFIAHQPIQQLEFECSPGLKLFGWSGVAVHDWQERENHVFLDLAEPLVGPAQITVRALAPGPIEGQWNMPRFELAHGIWTRGQTRIRSVTGLNLYAPHVVAGRVSSAQELAGGRPELIVEHAAPDARFTVRASADMPQVFARVHSTVELGPRLETRVAASWQIMSGETTAVQLRIPPDWSLEDVDVAPERLLARWSVESDESLGRIATLRCMRSLGPGSAISAMLRLRGLAMDANASRGEFTIPRLQPVGVYTAEETLVIELKPSWSAELIEAKHVSAIARPSAMSPSAAESSPALSFRFDGQDADGKIVVTRRAPELTAKIEVNADVNEEMVRADYALDLDIANGQPDWVDVSFHAETRDGLTWQLPEGVRAERLDTAAWPAIGTEFWRITLSRKDVRRTRLNASWRSAGGVLTEIPLPTILQATPTAGQVAVSYPVELELNAETADLIPNPASHSGDAGSSTRSGRQRQFWRFGTGTPQLAVRVVARPNLLIADSWVAHTKLRSTLDAQGSAIHTLQYEIHSQPGTVINLELPATAARHSVYSNGRLMPFEDSDGIQLTCPPDREVWTVEVQFTTSERALGRWARLDFRLPNVSIPSSRFTWEIELPAGYEAVAWPRELIATPPHAGKAWAERLFGPLVRDWDATPFTFWKPNAWRTWWQSQTRPAPDPLTDQLVQALEAFDREGLPRDRTWARLIAHVDQFTEHRLVVDTIGLRDSGVDLDSRATLQHDTAADSHLGLARALELNLLRTKHGLLLTSRASADELATPQDGTNLRLLNGRRGFAAAIDEATVHGADVSGRFVLANRWHQVASPHESKPRIDMATAIGPPWRFVSLADPTTVSVTVIEKSLTVQAMTTIVCTTLFLAFARKSRPGRWWLGGLSCLVATAFVLALVLSDALAAPALVLAWSQLALLIIWSRRSAAEARGWSGRALSRQLPSTVTQIGTAGALLLLWIIPWQSSSAETQDKDSTQYSLVFLPYDPAHPNKRHEASRVLVPRATYDRLVELADSAGDGVEPVLIRAAAYTGRMVGDRLELAIDLEIESLESKGPVKASCPLIGLLIRSAQLDGKPCLLESGPEGLTVEVRGRGIHKLHMDTVLAVDAAAGEGSFDWKIPPTPAARLDIELSPGITWDLEPASASIEWIKETQKQRLRAELGAVDRVLARWRRGPAVPAELIADFASLYTSKLGASRLEVRGRITVESGSSRKLEFELDPRLVLERVRATGMSGYWLRPGDRPKVVVEFERQLEKQTTVGLEFLVPNDADPKVHVPGIRIADARVGSRLIALRADPMESLEFVDPQEPMIASAEDFESVWGETLPRTSELRIVQLPPSSLALQLEAKQTVDQPVFHSHAQLRVTATRVDLITQLTDESNGAMGFRHELALPAGLELFGVRASAGTQWRQVAPDRLVWFGLSTGDSAASIELQGSVTTKLGSGRLPVVRPLGECQLRGDLTVWRSGDLDVVVFDEQGMTQTTLNPEIRPPVPNLIGQAHYEITSAKFTAAMKVEPLNPLISATVANRVVVDEAGAEWIAVLEYQVAAGSLSKLEFRVPDTIVPPLQIAGEGICHRAVRRQGPDQVWTIRLDEPRWSSYRLVLRARIELGHDGPVPVPTVDPLDVAELRKYLLVVNTTDDQFELSGTTNQRPFAVDGFSQWFSEPVPQGTLGSFELRDPTGTIEIQRARPAQSSPPQTTLIESHRLWLKPAGIVFMESTLLIRARTEGDAVLSLPNSAAVLDLHVDGHAVRPIRKANGQFACYLTADSRPHEVQLYWSWELPESTAAYSKPSVALSTLSNDKCPVNWTVYSHPQWRISSSNTRATCRSVLDAAATRALADHLEQLSKFPGGLGPNERAAVTDAEQAFVESVESVVRSLAAEANIGLSSSRLRSDHEAATLQVRQRMDANRVLLQRSGLVPSRVGARAQFQGFKQNSRALQPISGHGASPTAVETFRRKIEVPQLGTPAYFATDGQKLALSFGMADLTYGNAIDYVPAAIFGLAVWCVCTWLAHARRRALAVAIILAALGSVWCWKLRIEPLGPALLLAAAIVALGGWIGARNRVTKPQAFAR